jgi:polysaccharide export outer membrane protein
VGADYVLAPEDSVQITVWKEPALSGTLPIRPDGMISLALLGDLKAAGSTPMMLSNDIAIRLKKYVNDPRVTVTVLGVHVDKIFLLGEVGHVGELPLTLGMTPLQAISAAGGLTPYANAKHIYILRKQGGQERRIPFNYKKALKNGDEQGVSLIPGDTIVVP